MIVDTGLIPTFGMDGEDCVVETRYSVVHIVRFVFRRDSMSGSENKGFSWLMRITCLDELMTEARHEVALAWNVQSFQCLADEGANIATGVL